MDRPQKPDDITFTITDETIISQKSENGNVDAQAEQITADAILQVELNENNEAVSILIKAISGRNTTR